MWGGLLQLTWETQPNVKERDCYSPKAMKTGAVSDGGVAEWLRRSVANLVRSSVLGSSPAVGTILPQANSQLSCPSFRGR